MRTTPKRHQPGRATSAFNASVWGVQALLSATLVGGGLWKIVTPRDELAQTFPWVVEVPAAVLYGTSALDVLGGIGILLPTLTRIKPGLTVAASAGVVGLQISAIAFHVSRGEGADVGFNVVMIALASYVGWGRAFRVPVSGRQ